MDLALERRHPRRIVAIDVPREIDERAAVGLGGDGRIVMLSFIGRWAERLASALVTCRAPRPLSAIITPLSWTIPHPSHKRIDAFSRRSTKDAGPDRGRGRRAGARSRRDDKAMLRAAADLTRDLNVPDGADLLDRLARLGAGRLWRAGARRDDRRARWSMLVAGLVSILALFRAGSFIHELTHIKKGELRGFKLGWNLHRRHAAADPVLPLRGHPQPPPRQDPLRHGRGSRISAARADEAVDACRCSWSPPRSRRSRLLFRFAVLAPLSLLVPRAAQAGRRALFGAADQPALPPQAGRGRACPPVALAGSRGEPVGDRADRRWSATGIVPLQAVLVFLGVTSGIDAAQPDAHPGRASVGE